MIANGAIFAAGLLAWTLLEYVIHGTLAHLHQTFVTPLHAVHHRDPSAVFALTAWPPSLAVAAVLIVFFGAAPGVFFYLGLLCGFGLYEVEHYRIHYAHRLLRFERGLRHHHLVHHLRRPRMCLGVVTSFWDRVFGTEPAAAERAALYASVSGTAPLTAPSNLQRILASINPSARKSMP